MKRLLFVFVFAHSSAVFAQSDGDMHMIGLVAKGKGDCEMAARAYNAESPSAKAGARWAYDMAEAQECLGDLNSAVRYYEAYRKAFMVQGGAPPPQIDERLASIRYTLVKKEQADNVKRAADEVRYKAEERRLAEERRAEERKEEAERRRRDREIAQLRREQEEQARRDEANAAFDLARMKDFENEAWRRKMRDLFLKNILTAEAASAMNTNTDFFYRFGGHILWFGAEYFGKIIPDDPAGSAAKSPKPGIKGWNFSLEPLAYGGWYDKQTLYSRYEDSVTWAIVPYLALRYATQEAVKSASGNLSEKRATSTVLGAKWWLSVSAVRLVVSAEYSFFGLESCKGFMGSLGIGLGF